MYRLFKKTTTRVTDTKLYGEKKDSCLIPLHIIIPISNKIEKNRILKESPRKNENVAGSICLSLFMDGSG
jgi:hypothetical protein